MPPQTGSVGCWRKNPCEVPTVLRPVTTRPSTRTCEPAAGCDGACGLRTAWTSIAGPGSFAGDGDETSPSLALTFGESPTQPTSSVIAHTARPTSRRQFISDLRAIGKSNRRAIAKPAEIPPLHGDRSLRDNSLCVFGGNAFATRGGSPANT